MFSIYLKLKEANFKDFTVNLTQLDSTKMFCLCNTIHSVQSARIRTFFLISCEHSQTRVHFFKNIKMYTPARLMFPCQYFGRNDFFILSQYTACLDSMLTQYNRTIKNGIAQECQNFEWDSWQISILVGCVDPRHHMEPYCPCTWARRIRPLLYYRWRGSLPRRNAQIFKDNALTWFLSSFWYNYQHCKYGLKATKQYFTAKDLLFVCIVIFQQIFPSKNQ